MERPDPQQTEHPSPDVAGWLSGGGEMGKVVREKDWSNTPLGPIESWPQSLRTTVSLCLASNFPISIAWGPQRIQIYNDGYWPICATKHPRSMGQDFKQCWASPWPVIGETFERASNGETCFLVNQRMFLDRLGYLEETFFTFSFSPIRDESGGVGGLFHPVTELTQQSLAERRLGILRDLANQSSKATSIDEAITLIADSVEKSDLDVPFALIYRLEADGKSARLVKSMGLTPGLNLTPHCVTLDESPDVPWSFSRVVSRQTVVNNLAQQFGQMRCGPYDEPPGSAVVQPILLPGMTQLFGFFVAGVSSRRPLDESYSAFYDMLGDVVTNTMGKARAYEEERKRAEALAELDRAKTAFFSNVSHEFRTPLTLMLGPLEELLARNDSDVSPSDKGQLKLINRNGLRLLRLVNTLLDFSRIEAGRVQASYVPTDLAALTADLASSFRAATDQAGLRLVVDCHTLSEPVYIDREMWEKIVLNLMSNAFKFTFGGRITVTLREVERMAELRVCDTGVGIPPDHLSRIFERFHRVENTRSRTHEGSGIGLGLVKELVKLHGGSIRVQSVQDEGSTFIVVVPLSKEHLPSDQIVTAPTELSTAIGESPFVEEAMQWTSAAKDGELPSDTKRGKGNSKANLPESTFKTSMRSHTRPQVLLADDNADMRHYVGRILSERYDVHAVADGEAALAALNQRPYDLVLSDVMMPRLDGFGLLQKMRKDPATRTIPLILLSARAGEESRVEGLDQGADDYLIKPFSARELLARVDAHVNLSCVRLHAQAETQKFVSLVEKSNEFIGMCDLEYRPFFINAAGMDMVGLDGLEHAQRIVMQDFFSPEDRPFIQNELFPQVLREGQAEVEIRFRHFKTGEFLWMICHLFTLRDANGSSIGLATVSRNITGRKQAEEALRQSEERFRSVFKFAATGIAISDLEGRFQQCNPAYCTLLGYTEDEIRGLNFANLVHPEDRAVNMTEIRKLKDQKLPFFEIENRYLHKDGIPVWVRKFVSVLRNDSGTPTHLVAFVTDITERKEVEEQLYRWKDQLEARVKERTQDLEISQVRLRSLASQLSLTEQRERRNFAKDLHDNLAQLLVVGRMKLEQGKTILSTSPAANLVVSDVDDIFQQALTYSRTTIAELSPPPLHEAGLSTALRWLSDLMMKHGLVADVHMSQESIHLSENRAILVFQSVRELLMNVLKHAGVKQAIVKVLTKQNGDMCISVEDSGIGVDDEALHRAQEPGHLGLFAVQERMEAVGGRVDILSTPGQGTKVTLVFPEDGVRTVSSEFVNSGVPDTTRREGPSDPNLDSIGPLSSTQGVVLQRIRVLLVDDHAMLRKGLQTLLNSYDNLDIIGEAGDGEEAVSMAERMLPDVVVMDINMPKLNGVEATRLILKTAPAIKIIGYSVNDSPKILAAMLEAGAVACHEKTGSGKEVYQAICAAYAKR